jgi:hypothetical protein
MNNPFDPSLNSIDFANNTKDKEQIVRATVGQGTIITNSDTTNLNRNIIKTKGFYSLETNDAYINEKNINNGNEGPIQVAEITPQRLKFHFFTASQQLQYTNSQLF